MGYEAERYKVSPYEKEADLDHYQREAVEKAPEAKRKVAVTAPNGEAEVKAAAGANK